MTSHDTLDVLPTNYNNSNCSCPNKKVIPLDNGNFMVVWILEDEDGTSLASYARIYDFNGIAIGKEFIINPL